MEALIDQYADQNVFFFHTLGGDEDLPNIHFKKHYRLRYPIISDNLDRYRHIIRVSGITNVAVFGGDGACVFNKSFMAEAEDFGGFEKVIDGELAKLKGPNRKKDAYVENGTVYAPQVKEKGRIVHERMPSIAAGPSQELHLAYVTDARGSNDVLLRSYARGRWRKPAEVAASRADEYAPSVVAVAKDLALVAYVSDENGRYDIYTAFVKSGRVRQRMRVTRSSDDAMAPVLCRGERGDLWLAWYEWAKMGHLSRDREVYVARFAGKGWSEPIRVSPPDVPTYEDHADPVLSADGQGGVWVAWAWDYHGTLRTRPPVAENSIFARHVDANLRPGNVLAVGYRGEGRARDYAPTIAVSRDGVPWVAWDNSHKSSLGYSAKAVFLNKLDGEDFGEQVEVAASNGPLDSPRLVLHPKGELFVVWGQQGAGGWELCLRRVGPEGLGEGKRPIAVDGGEPRYPSACFDSKGNLWVAYTVVTPRQWAVGVKAIPSG